MKKIFLTLLVIITSFNFSYTFALDSDDIFSLGVVIEDVDNHLLYTVPAGMDLIIQHIYYQDETHNLMIRDGSELVGNLVGFTEYYTSIIIKDTFYLQHPVHPGADDHVTFFGVLVIEGTDISNIIVGEKTTGHLTKEHVASLLQFEVVVIWIMGLYTFYIKVLRNK